jgi:hypothetical protein
MPNQRQTIQIHLESPQKPGEGAPCNGCGVCCLTEPCPLGVVLSGRRQGACEALRWSEAGKFYRCGTISEPEAVLREALPVGLRLIAKGLSPVLALLAKRWIAAGQGCDSTLEVEFNATMTRKAGNSPTISPTLGKAASSHHVQSAHRHDKPKSPTQKF